jgi:heat-inducible transcriptional repressor
MDERKHRVLRAIIDDYIHTGEPVGSRTVARKYNLGVSAATIRNEMADLEDMGYLEQPHTSAGRVPSDKGYRYYVDTLFAGDLPPSGAEVAGFDQEAVRQVLAVKARRMDSVIRQATHLLAEATNFLALASQPAPTEERLVALQFVPLRDSAAVMLVVADTGLVRTKVVHFADEPSEQDLERIGRAFTERLRGVRLQELGQGLGRAIAAELGQYRDLVDEVRALLGDEEEAAERVVMDGATNLLKQPEFHQVAAAQRVLHALEREQLLEELLGVPEARLPGLEVAIGREMRVEEMQDCSLVTAVYAAPGGVLGRLGVLGPRRMDYARVMRLVEGVAEAVTATLGQGLRARAVFLPGPVQAPAPPRPAGGGEAQRESAAAREPQPAASGAQGQRRGGGLRRRRR